ncbi:MAG: alpha/beta hydrolase domain-containing protein [Acetobacteraceae bacterium]
MITGIEVRETRPFLDGARFGAAGAYEWVEGVASGAVDPAQPGNTVIEGIGLAPRNARGLVEYRTDFVVLRPTGDTGHTGRLLYEVNNRGRKMIFANLCAGAAGNVPRALADVGNAFPLRRGFTLAWSGWDAGAPRANGGLGMDAPVAMDGGVPVTQRIREEFISGTRLGALETFCLAYEAASAEGARLTVRRTQTGARRDAAFGFVDARTIRLLPEGVLPEPGSIYEFHYQATKPRVLGLGFAATRDFVSYLRSKGTALAGRPVAHTLGFGISQAGRYLRTHIALGFNRDEDGGRVFDGVFTHVAGIGRVFHNALFAQPARTRTWHEDHDFPEVAFPFSATALTDPISGATGALLRGDGSDPVLIETNTSTEYWQKGASLLHTDPTGARDVALPETVRGYLLAGTQHAGKAGMPRDRGPCVNPRNGHDPMGAVRALLAALDAWVAEGVVPPPSRLPRIDDGSLVPAEALAFPAIAGAAPPPPPNDVVPLGNWIDPMLPPRAWVALVPQVDTDGNEIAGVRLPDIAVPAGTYTGWNCYAAPYPAGEIADRDGSFLSFAQTRAERERTGDPRLSVEERPAAGTRAAVAAALVAEGLLLEEDAPASGAAG